MNRAGDENFLYGQVKDGYELVYVCEAGGRIWRHLLVDVKGIDYDEVMEIAVDKANIGCEVEVLPVLVEGHPLREVVFAGAKARKCPDLRVEGRFVEMKTPTDKLHQQKISHSIKLAAAQADEVIIRLTSSFDVPALAGIAKGRFLTHKALSRIEFKMARNYYSFKRTEFI